MATPIIDVVLENSKTSEVFGLDFFDQQQRVRVLAAVGRWLASACETVKRDGRCVSFQIGVHACGPTCDHEHGGRT